MDSDQLDRIIKRIDQIFSDHLGSSRKLPAHPDKAKQILLALGQLSESVASMRGLSEVTQQVQTRNLGRIAQLTDKLAKVNDELTRTQSRLVQSQKIEALGTMAAGVAHDFNNILGVIRANAQLTMLDLPEESEARSHLETITAATTTGADLVRQILTYTRPDTVRLEPLDVATVVRETLDLAKATLPAGIEIILGVRGPAGCVMANRTQLHEVILNLCSNASQAVGPKGGQIEIVVGQREGCPPSEGEANRPCVMVQVRDEGCGISPEDTKKIFDPFFTTKEVGKGTGLGLAVVYGIVTKLEGEIAVESEVGAGTTFTILLPLIAGTF